MPRNLELLLDPIPCCPAESSRAGVGELKAGGLSAEAILVGTLVADELMDALVAEEFMADALAADELMGVLSLDWLIPGNSGSRGLDLFDIISAKAPVILSSSLFVSALMIDNLEF